MACWNRSTPWLPRESWTKKPTEFSKELVTGLRAAKEAGAGLWTVLKGVGSAVSFIAQHTGGYANLAKVLAAIYLANKALRFGGAVAGSIGRLGGRGGFGGGAAGAMMERGASPANPLFVTMVGGGPGAVAGGKTGKGKTTRAGRLSGMASKAAVPLALAYGAYSAYDIATDESASTARRFRQAVNWPEAWPVAQLA